METTKNLKSQISNLKSQISNGIIALLLVVASVAPGAAFAGNRFSKTTSPNTSAATAQQNSDSETRGNSEESRDEEELPEEPTTDDDSTGTNPTEQADEGTSEESITPVNPLPEGCILVKKNGEVTLKIDKFLKDANYPEILYENVVLCLEITAPEVPQNTFVNYEIYPPDKYPLTVKFYGPVTIHRNAFKFCYNIKTVLFYGSSHIENEGFLWCYDLIKVDFYGLATFGNGAFILCDKLKEAVFHDQTKLIYKTFQQCASLNVIYLNNSVNLDNNLVEVEYMKPVNLLKYLVFTLIGTNDNPIKYIFKINKDYNPYGIEYAFTHHPSILDEDYGLYMTETIISPTLR